MKPVGTPESKCQKVEIKGLGEKTKGKIKVAKFLQ